MKSVGIRSLLATFCMMALFATGCATQGGVNSAHSGMHGDPITKQEVLDAQLAWGNGIVKIGNAHTNGEDTTALAQAHIEKFYAYNAGPGEVLFKPTLAADDQFRGDTVGALSYFVGGNPSYTEDGGFALAPYTNVRWQNEDIILLGNVALAMGNYWFTKTDGEEVKVEYSFGYIRDENGDLKINLHHSSLPFDPS